jgi:hypothetical protein
MQAFCKIFFSSARFTPLAVSFLVFILGMATDFFARISLSREAPRKAA